MKETLYLYKVLENLVKETLIIEDKYKNNFMRKILTLPNKGIEEVIKVLIRWWENLKKETDKVNAKEMIYLRAFLDKSMIRNNLK